ncbi:hypothetical protein SLS53_000260 [Cytospora paraplurivora]|uniref:FAD-binding domain-containing protein n=1 Tax=Cytospora paraplurivora TaxID=2898453 RepID=A0AAN9UKT1_9PEZI
MAAKPNPILIIGAGLAGLTTARLLTNHGIPNIVFEASQPQRSQGFSISLRGWGYTVLLDALGDIPLRSLTRGVAPDRQLGRHGHVDLIMRDNRTGAVLVAPDPTTQPAIVRANRNALRAWIANCGAGDLDIRYGHRLRRVHHHHGGGATRFVVAEFDNGAHHTGSFLVAADGVFSAVRAQVLPRVMPEVIPAVVYHGEFRLSRAEFDRDIAPLAGDSNILAGVGDGFNTPITVCNLTRTHADLDWSYSRAARLGRGEEDPLYRPNATAEEARQVPQALFDELASLKLAEPWSKVLSENAIRNHSVFQWTSRCVSVTKEEAMQAATEGVIFVGDSWHAMPIFGGEGGCHALVDAVELAAAPPIDGLHNLCQRHSPAFTRTPG